MATWTPDPTFYPSPKMAMDAPREALAGLPAGADRLYLIDPLGNLVLAFPRDPDLFVRAARSFGSSMKARCRLT